MVLKENHDLREKLMSQGFAVMQDTQGRSLHLIHTRKINLSFDGVLIAYEGVGAYTFDRDRPLNAFRLVSAGFPMAEAQIVARLVNDVTDMVIISPPMLAAPIVSKTVSLQTIAKAKLKTTLKAKAKPKIKAKAKAKAKPKIKVLVSVKPNRRQSPSGKTSKGL